MATQSDLSPGTELGSRKTARDLVADRLRQAILKGELAEGERLSVGKVATLFGVSHTPTREAFQLLAGEGFVRINAYRGAYVAELSADEYEEIMLMRIALEGLATKLGTEAIDVEGITAMRHSLEGLTAASEADDVERFIAVDREFHAVHYRASARETLWERIISLRYTAERYTRRGYQIPGISMKDTVKSHGRLFAAVVAGEAERAKNEMTTDLNNTFQVIWSDVRKREQEPKTA